ncbi:hypothetical protein DPV78_003930 [Talaromyces pinophilus]|nr:hypothetical protein DPV78_003930 [Talaromyces pinophilus]
MSIRDSPNLIRKGYGRSKWENAIDYINEMQNQTISLSSRGTLHSSPDYDLRIDNQGEFTDTCNGITWYNIQLQENVGRGGGNDTTVFTLYVHKEGYENMSDHLHSATILKAMQQMAYHQMPECCVFIAQEGNRISASRIPRSPYGLRGYKIWRK